MTRPLFIFITKRDGSNLSVNANAIIYYKMIGLGPGLGTELFFTLEHSVETIHGPIELEKMIRGAIEDSQNPFTNSSGEEY